MIEKEKVYKTMKILDQTDLSKMEGIDEKFKEIYSQFELYIKYIGTFEDIKVIKEQYRDDENFDLINKVLEQMEEYIIRFQRLYYVLKAAIKGEIQLEKELLPYAAYEITLEFAPTYIKTLNSFAIRAF